MNADIWLADNSVPFDRRRLLKSGTSLAGLGLCHLATNQNLFAANKPLMPTVPHREGKAKSVIWFFTNGGPSHVDTWDYKPELIKRHGQPMPGADKLITFQGEQGALSKSPWEFRPRGQSGKMISDLLPRLAAL